MIPRRPTPEQQRNLIRQRSTMHGRGEHLQSLTTSTVCLLPTDLTVTHPSCPATLAMDKVTRRIHVYDGTGWKPLVDTIVSATPQSAPSTEPAAETLTRDIDVRSTHSTYGTHSTDTTGGTMNADRAKYTVFSDADFALYSNGVHASTLTFDIVPYSRPRTITVPKENIVLPAIDTKSNILLGSVVYSTTDGVCTDNTLLGADAGSRISSGSFNTAVGSMALGECVVGGNNVSIGYKSMDNVTSGSDNVSVGYKSLRKTQSECNIAIGSFSQAQNVLGSGNVSVGQDSLYGNVSGSNNVALGYESGVDSSVGDNNILIGAQTNFSSGTSGSIVLGVGGTSSASGQFVLSGKMTGVVELQSGTGVVIFGGVTDSTRILLTIQTPGGTVGTVYVAGRIPGTGFTVSSTSSRDSSVVGWFAIEP